MSGLCETIPMRLVARIFRVVRILIVLLVAAAQGGCLLTTHMWKDANNEFAFGPQLVVTDPNSASPGRTRVIYEVGGLNTSTYLLFDVPAELEKDFDLSPQEWLRQGPTTLADPASTEADAARYARVATLSLPDECFIRPVSFGEKQNLIATSRARWLTHDPRGSRIPTSVRVFMTDGFGDVTRGGPTVHLADGHAKDITPATKLFAIPQLQRRPKREQNGAKVRAALFTPLTIVGDTVLAPVYLILLMKQL